MPPASSAQCWAPAFLETEEVRFRCRAWVCAAVELGGWESRCSDSGGGCRSRDGGSRCRVRAGCRWHGATSPGPQHQCPRGPPLTLLAFVSRSKREDRETQINETHRLSTPLEGRPSPSWAPAFSSLLETRKCDNLLTVTLQKPGLLGNFHCRNAFLVFLQKNDRGFTAGS